MNTLHTVSSTDRSHNLVTVHCGIHTPVKSIILAACALLDAQSISDKSFILNDLITHHKLDFLFLTETLLKPGECSPLVVLCPPIFTFLNSPRLTGRGGGIASVFKKHFSCTLLSLGSFNSLEILTVKIVREDPICCITIYRPPNLNSSSGFLTEFSALLSSLVLKFDKAIIAGDFNIHIDKTLTDFLNICKSFNLVQHVPALHITVGTPLT